MCVQSDETSILVVEDDPALRRIFQEALEDDGLAVRTAANGPEAVHLALQQRPSLVVLDIALPGLNGVGVAAALRQGYSVPPPILVITADGDPLRKAQQAGAFAFLVKPLDLEDLLAAVQRGLRAA